VPQLRPVTVPLTAGQVLLSARYPDLGATRLAPAESDFAAVREAARQVGVEAFLGRPIDELSGGERQAVYIAAALAQETELLVLDEPTTLLDAGNRRRVASLLLALRRRATHTLIVATHDLRFAGLLCDRLVALKDGVVAGDGPPRAMLRPEILQPLFDASFRLWRDGDDVLPVLDLEGGVES
jgi:iron complex transport system ATP-binding protein